jgi:seryl-tRNA synthetase
MDARAQDEPGAPDGPCRPVDTGTPGVFLSPAPYERIVAALRQAVDAMAPASAWPPLTVPPVISRSTIERAGYARSFPHLLGTVHAFAGSSREWRSLAPLVGTGDWHRAQAVTDLVLLPAACYHAYPLLADTDLPDARQFCVHATCFRQEPSAEPGRLRSFRMSELVYAGTAQECVRWRDDWLERIAQWFADLGLSVSRAVADDPFFGPGDRLLRATQREQRLKWELLVPLDGGSQAIASGNCHLEHFGAAFGFTAQDAPAHSACFAFGLDRIALALIRRHGPDAGRWPVDITAPLRPRTSPPTASGHQRELA